MTEDKEHISALSYRLGKQIEHLINVEVGDVKYRNDTLEVKILTWYQKTKDEEFKKHFNIKDIKENGKV